MDNSKNKYIFYIFLLALVFVYSCRKENWDEHNALVDQDLSKNLLQVISEKPELSKYAEYLVKTGYDKVLSQSQSYTVWAPGNDALAGINPEVINTDEKLKQFIGNTISNQAFFTNMPKDSLIIPVLNGKRILFTATTFEEANIVAANQYVSNGVLHITDQAILPKLNAWEFLQSYSGSASQYQFIKGQDHLEIDTSKAIFLYTDPVTQKPVYQSGTTTDVIKNYFFQNVTDMTDEDSLSTYIILTDAAFESEKNKLSPYYSITDKTLLSDTLTKWNVVKDLVIKGVYTKDKLPDSLLSKNGVQIHIDKSSIVETRTLSNGIAYVVNKIDYKVMENKIPTIIVQGELPDSLSVSSGLSMRTKRNPDGVTTYTDLQLSSLTKAGYYFKYSANLNKVRYKVYWRAINDIYTVPFKMTVGFHPLLTYYQSGIIMNILGPKDVEPNFYGEVLLGEYAPDEYGNLNIFLVSSDTASSTTPAALTLDYLKFVPVN